MLVKKFFKNNKSESFFKEMEEDFKPLINKVRNPVLQYAKRNPYKTFWIMFSLVAINIAVLAIFTKAYKSETIKFSNIGKLNPISATKEELKKNNNTQNFSLSDILELNNLKDTLSFLMAQKTMTHSDTLTFLRLTEKFSKIDKSFKPVKMENLVRVDTTKK